MSSDTAELLRQHVSAVQELIAGEKPDQITPEDKKREKQTDEE